MGVEEVERADVVRIALARFGRCARRQIEIDVIDDTRLHVRAQIFGDDIKTTPGFELFNTRAQRKLFGFRSWRRLQIHLHRRAAKFYRGRHNCPSLLWGLRRFRSHLRGGAGGHWFVMIVGVSQLPDSPEILDRAENLIPIFIGEDELMRQPRSGCRIQTPGAVPTLPQSIDVAVMHPEDGRFPPARGRCRANLRPNPS